MKKALIYSPYMDILGGGERHIISIADVLAKNGFHIDIAWDDPQILKNLTEFLHVDVSTYGVVKNVFKQGMSVERHALTAQYDIFIYVTDGSYFTSKARKNVIFSMYPDKKLYSLFPKNWWPLRKYDVIANGDFTAERVSRWLHKPVTTIYPFVDTDFFVEAPRKQRIILSVGRFFKHLHSKRQDVLIQAFTRLQHDHPETKEYTLILAGGLRPEDQPYMDELEKLAGLSRNIIFRPNVSYEELLKLYMQAHIYWHAAGFGIDEKVQPELVEHVGISPLEAMASQCIPMCYASGGPARYIVSGNNGFLYSSIEELVESTAHVLQDASLQAHVMNNAKVYVGTHFSYPVFKNKVEQFFRL